MDASKIAEGSGRWRGGPLTGAIIAAAIEVHRHLGQGLIASIYEEALCIELPLRGIPFARQLQNASRAYGHRSPRRGTPHEPLWAPHRVSAVSHNAFGILHALPCCPLQALNRSPTPSGLTPLHPCLLDLILAALLLIWSAHPAASLQSSSRNVADHSGPCLHRDPGGEGSKAVLHICRFCGCSSSKT